MPSPLDSIKDFGDIAAEINSRPEFFVTSASWRRVRQGAHPIVIGRKGTGKTALRLALLDEAQRSPMMFATDLSFRDYPWNAHNAISDSRVGHRSRYVETWLFLMQVELAKLVVGENQSDHGSDESHAAVNILRDFVRQNWGRLPGSCIKRRAPV